jgi:hypothetical protein
VTYLQDEQQAGEPVAAETSPLSEKVVFFPLPYGLCQLAVRRSAMPRHFGADATFVDKDQTVAIKLGLVRGPCHAPQRHTPIPLSQPEDFGS